MADPKPSHSNVFHVRRARHTYLTMTSVATGEIKVMTIRNCEDWDARIMHETGMYAECSECCHVNHPA